MSQISNEICQNPQNPRWWEVYEQKPFSQMNNGKYDPGYENTVDIQNINNYKYQTTEFRNLNAEQVNKLREFQAKSGLLESKFGVGNTVNSDVIENSNALRDSIITNNRQRQQYFTQQMGGAPFVYTGEYNYVKYLDPQAQSRKKTKTNIGEQKYIRQYPMIRDIYDNIQNPQYIVMQPGIANVNTRYDHRQCQIG